MDYSWFFALDAYCILQRMVNSSERVPAAAFSGPRGGDRCRLSSQSTWKHQAANAVYNRLVLLSATVVALVH